MSATGAAAWGVAAATPVSAEACRHLDTWIADGCHASMAWLADSRPQRSNPEALLPGVKSIIVAAFPYRPSGPAPKPRLPISLYALGTDYHIALRSRLTPAAEAITAIAGAAARICIDSAPLLERYWAVRAGLGYVGRNNLLIIPSLGSMLFLATILTTATIAPDAPLDPAAHPCLSCPEMPCRRACPADAIRQDSTVDARRCLAFLTIEHRGPFPEGTNLHGRFFGCDACALACPLNHRPLPSGQPVPEFAPLPATLALSPEEIASSSGRAFARRFASSPLSRARLDSLRRNLDSLNL